jgi:hypothetical protein
MIVYGMALVLSNHSVQLEVGGGEKKGEEDTASGFASIPSFMGALSDMGRTEQSLGRELASPATGAVIKQCIIPSLTQRHCTCSCTRTGSNSIASSDLPVRTTEDHLEPSAANDAYWLASRSAKPPKSR